MRRRSVLVITFAGIAGAAVLACLNPQPLPPSDFSSAANSDAGADDSASLFSPRPSEDAGDNEDTDAAQDAGLDGDGDASDADAG
jgi:hypothetical protein